MSQFQTSPEYLGQSEDANCQRRGAFVRQSLVSSRNSRMRTRSLRGEKAAPQPYDKLSRSPDRSPQAVLCTAGAWGLRKQQEKAVHLAQPGNFFCLLGKVNLMTAHSTI